LEQEEQENGTSTNPNSKIVYDCMDPSPYYENQRESYINESEMIDLGPDDSGPEQAPVTSQTRNGKNSTVN
jgi:hypothetical protein